MGCSPHLGLWLSVNGWRPLERPKAKERKAQAKGEPQGKKKVSSGNLLGQKDTRDIIAATLGTSGKTCEKAKAVVEAAKSGKGSTVGFYPRVQTRSISQSSLLRHPEANFLQP